MRWPGLKSRARRSTLWPWPLSAQPVRQRYGAGARSFLVCLECPSQERQWQERSLTEKQRWQFSLAICPMIPTIFSAPKTDLADRSVLHKAQTFDFCASDRLYWSSQRRADLLCLTFALTERCNF